MAFEADGSGAEGFFVGSSVMKAASLAAQEGAETGAEDE